MLNDECADGRPIVVPIFGGSAGINGESSFEAALLERAPGCEVWGYDFTVKSVGSFNILNRSLALSVKMGCRVVWS
jgi:hypothetical protein